MRKYIVIVWLIPFVFYSCKSQVNDKDEFAVDSSTFSSQKFGWSMTIPEGWKVTQREDLEKQAEKGLKMLDKEVQEALQNQQPKTSYLLCFQKDKRKMFTSVAEQFDTVNIKFEQLNRNNKELIYNTLIKQGGKIDSSWGREIIDGKVFRTFKMTAFDKSNNPIVNQFYYNRQIDNFMLSIILLYDNNESKDALLEHWRKSKFDK